MAVTLFVRANVFTLASTPICGCAVRVLSTVVFEGRWVRHLATQLPSEVFGIVRIDLHIVRAEPEAPLRQARFAVMFAPLDVPGGWMQPHYCHGLANLAQFLQELGLTEKAVENIKVVLKNQESVSERLTLAQAKIDLF